MSGKRYGETYRVFQICVDCYHFGQAKGWLSHPGEEEDGVHFQSLAQMLIWMDDMMNSVNFPQSYTARRTFTPLPACVEENPSAKRQKGGLATFMVRILFRQHASWQGSVIWIEGHNEETFRSALELVFLMDSALGGCNGKQAAG